jgi:hypothetical protein
MGGDLNDILAAWLGHDVAPARRTELLSRLRADEGFRKAFAAEVRMYGMLRTVQSAEPRWLRLEDLLGWSADESGFESAVEERIAWEPTVSLRPRHRSRWLWGATAVAATLLAVISIALDWSIPPDGRSASGIDQGIPSNAYANGRLVPPPPPPQIGGVAMRHVSAQALQAIEPLKRGSAAPRR